jgi:two-component system sensor histidine kinase/response regulator
MLHDRVRLGGDTRLERMTNNIGDSTGQMLAFVEEFLANSAADQGLNLKIEPVHLSHATSAAVQQFAEAARRKGVGLEHANGTDALVAADRKALDQVLDNLISNALKFSPSGKLVRVSVRPEPNGGAAFFVRDEGPGFTDEDKSRMFHRYARLSARPTGGEPSTGLGLSIVKKLVEAMNGKLECESEHGNGASFKIVLPGPKQNGSAH